jgi:hypothetical protein
MASSAAGGFVERPGAVYIPSARKKNSSADSTLVPRAPSNSNPINLNANNPPVEVQVNPGNSQPANSTGFIQFNGPNRVYIPTPPTAANKQSIDPIVAAVQSTQQQLSNQFSWSKWLYRILATGGILLLLYIAVRYLWYTHKLNQLKQRQQKPQLSLRENSEEKHSETTQILTTNNQNSVLPSSPRSLSSQLRVINNYVQQRIARLQRYPIYTELRLESQELHKFTRIDAGDDTTQSQLSLIFDELETVLAENTLLKKKLKELEKTP